MVYASPMTQTSCGRGDEHRAHRYFDAENVSRPCSGLTNHRAPLVPGEIRTHTVGLQIFQVMHVSGGSYTQATVRELAQPSRVIATERFESDAVNAYADAIEQAESDAIDDMEGDDTPEPLTAEGAEALAARAGFTIDAGPAVFEVNGQRVCGALLDRGQRCGRGPACSGEPHIADKRVEQTSAPAPTHGELLQQHGRRMLAIRDGAPAAGQVFPRHLLMASGITRCGETHPTHTTRVESKVQCPKCIAQFTPDEARRALNGELTRAFDTLARHGSAATASTLADDVAAALDAIIELRRARVRLDAHEASLRLDVIESALLRVRA
jgi:hypothetical protein